MVDLVKGTLTGRNYGWLPDETPEAIAHVAKVVREDNGQGDLGSRIRWTRVFHPTHRN